MVRYRIPPRRSTAAVTARSLVVFLLIASFGILFAGCGAQPPPENDFSFTAQDVARFRELARQAQGPGGTTVTESGGVRLETGSGTAIPSVPLTGSGRPVLDASTTGEPPVLDLSLVKTYDAIRSVPVADAGQNVYQVTNEFVNVRSAPNITASQIVRLVQGNTVTVLNFVDAAWAKVRLNDNREGYVSQRYISKIVFEEQLAKEKEAFKGKYFVNFGFVNVRKAADSESELIGEIPGQAFVTPLSNDANWARISLQGKEGYVSMKYLAPFLPNFLVRQNSFTLPVLQIRLSQEGSLEALPRVIALLKKNGYNTLTLRSFGDLLLKQQQQDVRIDPKTVALAIADITAANVKSVSDALSSNGVHATLFISSKELGIDGITQKTIVTLIANGLDVESRGHTGDDLRSLTNAQVDLELRQSRKLLEDYTGRSVNVIGYPEGGVNDRVMKAAADAGYLLGVGIAPDATFQRDQLLRMPSFVVSAKTTDQEILTFISTKP